jgi:glycosyltransferase involved in cell wall biosynthesis
VGIEEASGPIIAILDDDDRWDPRFLAAHVEAHQDPAVQVVYSGHIVFWDDVPLAPKEVLAPPPPTDVFSEMIRGRFTIATNSVLTFKRAALDAVGGYDTMLTGFLDWDLLCRVAQRGRFAHIPAPLALFRMHLGVRDSDPSLRLAELGAVREKWSGYPAVERMIRRFTAEGFYNFSRNCGLRGDRAGARRYFGLYLRHLHPDSLDVSALLRLTILVIVGRDLYCRLQRRSQWRRTKSETTMLPDDS